MRDTYKIWASVYFDRIGCGSTDAEATKAADQAIQRHAPQKAYDPNHPQRGSRAGRRQHAGSK